MIVPENRLLFWTGAAVIPLALAWAVPGLALPAGLPVLVLFLLVITDAMLAGRRLNGVSLSLPEIIRLTQDRPGRFSLHIEHEGSPVSRLRIGLAFPPEIHTDDLMLAVRLSAAGASSFEWTCQANQRGRFHFITCRLEAGSRFGFWAFRKSVDVHSEIRVYPNLFSERKHMAALFLGRGGPGIHAQRRLGKGRDFEQLRDYLPGDSYDDIYWKATAKRRHPVTRIYQVERTQEVYVIVDASRLSARPDPETGTPSLERFVKAALILGLAAERQGDRYGLIVFSDRILSFIPAKSGKAHYDACREALYTLRPQVVTPDFDELFTFIGGRLNRRALLVALTNMDDPVLAESFSRHVHVIARRHLILAAMIRPPRAMPVFSSPDIVNVDDIYGALGGHYLWSQLRDTEKILKRRGVAFSMFAGEALCPELVAQYMSVKQRQAL